MKKTTIVYGKVIFEFLYTINIPDAETLGEPCDEVGASPVGLHGHAICCSGRYTCSSGGGVRLLVLKAEVAA